MQGKILEEASEGGYGVIVGEDSTHYKFFLRDCHGSIRPIKGEWVSFDTNPHASLKMAINITLLSSPHITYSVTRKKVTSKKTTPQKIQQTKKPPKISRVPPQLPKAESSTETAPDFLDTQQSPWQPEAESYDSDLLQQKYAEEESYTFFDWIKKSLRSYTDFSGRSRRKEYWYFQLFFYTLIILPIVIVSKFTEIDLDNNDIAENILITWVLIILVTLFIPKLAVTIRRLHDTGRSGWWYLPSTTPYLAVFYYIVLFVFFVSDTKATTNEWGPPAKKRQA